MMKIEICANSVTSALRAKEGGASRIELCQNLNEGGTTPSGATVEYCVHQLKLNTYVLVRPRPGNFVYSEVEMDVVLRDIELCHLMGAQAIVVGFLTENGDVDVDKTRQAVQAAGNMEVTFHRAFDQCRDWRQGLEDVITSGCTRLLSSGQRDTAMEGSATLRQMVEQAAGRITIMAGSGVKPENARALVDATGVTEVHASCKQHINGISETSSDQVRLLIAALHG
ncbi:MAG: copper homeostasis protein CutC [Bacteroidales bacterium]|nr:copper homeostasis protein CutC [Bacteroidales bacterium]